MILNKIDVEGAEKLRDDTVQKVKCMRGNLLIFVDAVKLVHVFFTACMDKCQSNISVIVLEAVSRELRVGLPCELL